MPWLLAGFLGMLFLIPFDNMRIPAATAVDGTLDRFFLIAILITWFATIFAKRAGGPHFPRNPLAAPVLIFLIVAFVSVGLHMELLGRISLLGLSLKKLSLLVSWVLIFFMVVTTIRPSEVRNFGKLIIGLATLTAIGTIIEYRTEYNIFWNWFGHWIPGFEINDKIKFVTIDSSGRRQITGPASHGLAAVTLVSLALPFALAELIHAKQAAKQVLYASALALLLAATFATSRKTSAFVPIGTVLVFMAYRPRQMLKLSPLLLILIPMIHVLAPNAMGIVRNQLFPKQGFLQQRSVEGRTEDYAAVKPDIRAHIVAGRGYGSYDHDIFRLLDNQYLVTVIETGFVGLAAYLMMILSVPWVTHRVIRFGDRSRAPPALAAAAAAVAFLIANLLFDALAFPQAPYAFIFIAGLAAVLASEFATATAPARVRTAPSAPRVPRTAEPITTLRG